MGNTTHSDNNFLDDWTRLEKQGVPGTFTNVWANKNNRRIRMQEYPLQVTSEEQVHHQRQVHEKRHDHRQLVSSLHFKDETEDGLCSSNYQGSIFIEKIPLTLQTVTDIPFPDALHIYSQSLIGFHYIASEIVKNCFPISEEHIGINCESICKVWMNSKFDRNFPSRDERITEEAMTRIILQTIEENVDLTSLQGKPSPMNYIQSRSPIVLFDEAISLLRSYSQNYFGGVIPEKLSCVDKVGGSFNLSKDWRTRLQEVKKARNNNEDGSVYGSLSNNYRSTGQLLNVNNTSVVGVSQANYTGLRREQPLGNGVIVNRVPEQGFRGQVGVQGQNQVINYPQEQLISRPSVIANQAVFNQGMQIPIQTRPMEFRPTEVRPIITEVRPVQIQPIPQQVPYQRSTVNFVQGEQFRNEVPPRLNGPTIVPQQIAVQPQQRISQVSVQPQVQIPQQVIPQQVPLQGQRIIIAPNVRPEGVQVGSQVIQQGRIRPVNQGVVFNQEKSPAQTLPVAQTVPAQGVNPQITSTPYQATKATSVYVTPQQVINPQPSQTTMVILDRNSPLKQATNNPTGSQPIMRLRNNQQSISSINAQTNPIRSNDQISDKFSMIKQEPVDNSTKNFYNNMINGDFSKENQAFSSYYANYTSELYENQGQGNQLGLKGNEKFTITQDKYNVNLNDGMSSQNFLSQLKNIKPINTDFRKTQFIDYGLTQYQPQTTNFNEGSYLQNGYKVDYKNYQNTYSSNLNDLVVKGQKIDIQPQSSSNQANYQASPKYRMSYQYEEGSSPSGNLQFRTEQVEVNESNRNNYDEGGYQSTFERYANSSNYSKGTQSNYYNLKLAQTENIRLDNNLGAHYSRTNPDPSQYYQQTNYSANTTPNPNPQPQQYKVDYDPQILADLQKLRTGN